MAVKKIHLSDEERVVVHKWNSPLYTPVFLEEWINRTDTIFENAPAALQCVSAKSFYDAVKLAVAYDRKEGKDNGDTGKQRG